MTHWKASMLLLALAASLVRATRGPQSGKPEVMHKVINLLSHDVAELDQLLQKDMPLDSNVLTRDADDDWQKLAKELGSSTQDLPVSAVDGGDGSVRLHQVSQELGPTLSTNLQQDASADAQTSNAATVATRLKSHHHHKSHHSSKSTPPRVPPVKVEVASPTINTSDLIIADASTPEENPASDMDSMFTLGGKVSKTIGMAIVGGLGVVALLSLVYCFWSCCMYTQEIQDTSGAEEDELHEVWVLSAKPK